MEGQAPAPALALAQAPTAALASVPALAPAPAPAQAPTPAAADAAEITFSYLIVFQVTKQAGKKQENGLANDSRVSIK